MKKNSIYFLVSLSVICLLVVGCKSKKKEDTAPITTPAPTTNNGGNSAIDNPITNNTTVTGYNLLSKIRGIWNGPITSSTAMGNFQESPMDFRPISASQISSKNELDKDNSVFMSFFIIYDGSRYAVAFRNGGTFSGMLRTAYMTLDSVVETGSYSYYRFVDFKKKKVRTITEVSFWADSLHIRAYTNKSNSLPSAVVHMDYRAGLQTASAYLPANTAFSFPQKQMVKDFSSIFNNVTESIYYSVGGDPYPEADQPYLGQSTLSYSISPSLTMPSGAKITLMVSTQPLIGTTGPIAANFKTRTRYVILTSPLNSFIFNYMHPGSYYLYALYDKNNNGVIDSGDCISTANTTFTLSPLGTVSASTQINYTIP